MNQLHDSLETNNYAIMIPHIFSFYKTYKNNIITDYFDGTPVSYKFCIL